MSHLPIGTVLKSSQHSYVVEAVLGKGGFGVTYKVSSIRKVGNVEARCTFAMKELFISDWCEREAEGNEVTYSTPLKDKVENCKIDFLAEARRLQQISHSSIVAVDEVFEANNTAYYVMEYLDMGNLSDYVSRNGCLSEDEVMRLLLPVFNAVKTLHEHRMTHLDIKPANIMMKESDDIIRPVLIDFGLSKHYDEQGNATSTVRTQGCSDGYAPIEQYAGIETFSPESDIYALGATMVYCFTGQHPPRAVDLDEEGVNALLPSTISQNMRNAITKAMRGARSKRTKSVVELLNDIKAASSVQNVGVSSPSNDSTIIRQVGSDATNVNPQIVEREADSTKVNVVNDEEKGTAIPLNNDEGESSNRKISSTMVILPIVIVAAILWIIFGGLFSDRASTDDEYFNTATTDSAVADTTYDDAPMDYDEEAPAIADSTDDEEAYDDYNVDYEDEDEATPTYSTLADTVTEYDNGANVTVIQNSNSNGRSITIVNGDTVWSDMRK